MFNKGKNKNLLTYCLVFSALLIAFMQIYTHKNSALSPWKGGGFGMYTAPHYKYHHVWINIQSDEPVTFRIWPDLVFSNAYQTEYLSNILQSPFHDNFRRHLDRFRHYPEDSEAKKLLALLREMQWDGNGENNFELEVFFTKFDISRRQILKERIYSSSDSHLEAAKE